VKAILGLENFKVLFDEAIKIEYYSHIYIHNIGTGRTLKSEGKSRI
jgi:hypothetical protein